VIVEIAVVHRKDGSTARLGREKGRKLFTLLTPAGEPDPIGLGYSRRSLEERPWKDRNVAMVVFEKTSPNGDGKEAA
jgi:hypothetical protein